MNRITTIVALLALMFTVQVTQAGLVGGGGRFTGSVCGQSTRVLDGVFRAYEDARIEVDGDGDTDLDVFVYDERGNLIASDEDSTDLCIVNFRPRWTGKFYIKIVNHGSVYNRYTFTVN